MRATILAFVVFLAGLGTGGAADLPRTVIGLYDLRPNQRPESHDLLRYAELPLNHLGLVLEPHDVLGELPRLEGRSDIRGVILWLEQDHVRDPRELVAFIEAAAARGIPVILMECLPVAAASDNETGHADYTRVLASIGVQAAGGWRPYGFDFKIVAIDKEIAGFERAFDGPLPPVEVFAGTGKATPVLTLERADGTRTSPILITERGAFIAPDYGIWREPGGERVLWRVNPFTLFARVFGTDDLPKPDPTTLSGRRIYYSHIDGDGWLNESFVEGYRSPPTYSSDVILREAIRPFPDLPVTVAPIAAELDPAFVGNPAAQEIARAIFALPQVEPGSHTYTHPFQWSFFGPGYTADKERPYMSRYRRTVLETGYDSGGAAGGDELEPAYRLPRAYGDIPFDVRKEIEGSARYISQFAPPDRPVRLVQWSGDTTPFPAAVRAAKAAGLLNINGGDTRFDADYPSYTGVAPFGRLADGARQIYTSQANENVYTDGWTARYGGFRHLLSSLANTENPRRVAAANVYYHMYSGEREAGLRALKTVLETAMAMEIAPVFASRYAEIANGFYTARIERTGKRAWRVHERGALATLRFDDASTLTVDYAKSEGVLGHRRKGSTLYVAMDGTIAAPLVALKDGADAPASRPWLIDSRWEISDFATEPNSATFAGRGFGPGEMRWQVTPRSRWRIETAIAGHTVTAEVMADAKGMLAFALPRGGEKGARVRMTHVGAPDAS